MAYFHKKDVLQKEKGENIVQYPQIMLSFVPTTINLYIGNLSYNVKESDLRHVMEEYGTVASVKLITDRETRRSKGFAFIEMPDDAEAAKAIEQLNGAEYVGRSMVVKEALPKN